MKYIYKIHKFMQGRYRRDNLYNFLLGLYFSLFIINLFLKSSILEIIELLIVIFTFYRVFSKNISKRRRENRWYLKVKNIFIKPFLNIRRNYKDREYYVYKKCCGCRSTLKLPLPKKRGIQKVKCPKCRRKFKFICFRRERIEVIKKK